MKKPAAKPRLANRATAGRAAGASPRSKLLAAHTRYREQYNPLRALTLARAVALLEDYHTGAMADLQWTYFHIEQTDEDLLALVELCLSRIAEMDWSIATNKDADPALAEAQSTYLRAAFDGMRGLEEAIEHLASAKFRGYAHVEKIYGPGGTIAALAPVDQWNVVRDGLKGPWRYNPEARSTMYAGLAPEHDMPPERFVFREVRRPVNRIALVKFIRANLSEKDWDAFIEIYGIPSGVVTGPVNVPAGKEAEYEEAALAISEGGSGYLPNGATYTQNKAETGGTPFKARLDHLSEKLILAGTGGKLTMLTDATGLGSGASDAHSAVFDSIASAEAGRISRVLTETLCAELLAARFPGQPHLAYFKLAANEETDTAALIADVAALTAAGYQLDVAEVAERTGWQILGHTPPASPLAPGGAGLFNRALPAGQGERGAGSTPDPTAKRGECDPSGVAGPGHTLVAPGGSTAFLGGVFKAIANRAGGEADQKAFDVAARLELSAAEREGQAALLERMAAMEALDDAGWLEAARRLDADLPAIYAQVLRAGGTAETFYRIYGAALADGMIEAADARPLKNAAPRKGRVSGPRAKNRPLVSPKRSEARKPGH